MLQNVGPYRIREVLGKGGMATVYRAEHEGTGAWVAIKVVSEAARPLAASIRRELHALARVSHPRVVKIVDQGALDGMPWYAMELLSGRTLRALHQEHWGHEAPPRVGIAPALHLVALLAAVCEPLAVLHAAGIVHGDLKPENIVVTEDRGPVLVDFGIAASFAGADGRELLGAADDLAGTPAYVAPERIRGEPVDARADLYALGCMLYECVLGQPPFVGTSASKVLYQHLNVAPRAPSLAGVAVPGDLEALILRLLAKRAPERIGYADDVAAILRGLGFAAAPAEDHRSAPYLYRSDLIGRDDHLRRAGAALDNLQRYSRGGALFIVGESGVGKTRLGIEIANRASQRGMTVVTGQCRSLTGAEAPPLHPFAPLVTEVVDRCHADGDATRALLLEDSAPMLAPYFADLAPLAALDRGPELPPLPLEAARARVLDAVTRLLYALAAMTPLVVVLDDVQWADELSLALLARLDEATLAERGVLCVALSRAEENGERLEGLVRRMGATRWDIGRLDEEGVSAMAAGMLAVQVVPRAWVDLLARASAGNPFFLAEYLRAAVGAGMLARRSDGRWSLLPVDAAGGESIAVPASIGALIARRIEGLGRDERQLLAAAAVLGRAFVSDLAMLTAALDERAALDAVSVLKQRQILEEGARGELRFIHDRIHDVAFARLGADERRELHGRAANAIATLHPGDPAQHAPLGRHYAGAGEHAAACHHFGAAARRAEAAYANEQAISLYHAALGQAEASGAAGALLADLWTRIGEIEQRTGHATGAHAAYVRALAHIGPSAPAERASLHRRQGMTWDLQQHHREALACYAEAERCLGHAPADDDASAGGWWREWVQIEIERISIHYWAADMEALDAVVERLAPVVEQRGSAPQRARFFGSRVQRNLRHERYQTSPATVALAQCTLAASSETNDRELTAATRFTLAAVLLWHDALDEAEACMRAALDEAERMHSLPLQCRCLAYLTVIGRRRRDREATRAMAWRCQSVSKSARMTEYLGTAEANLGWVQLQEGNPTEAEALCRGALARWHGLALAHPFEWLARLPLLALLPTGDDEAARQQIQALLAPTQQRLPAALETALARAGASGREGVREALALAAQLGFV